MENVKRRLIERFKKIINEPHLLFPVLGFIFVSLLGTLLHFLYDLFKIMLLIYKGFLFRVDKALFRLRK